jgi:hypothetical protein
LFFVTVALVAALDEERADLAFEKSEIGRVYGRQRARGQKGEDEGDEGANHRMRC